MAHITKRYLHPVAPPPPYKLTVELSQEEAETLRTVLEHVGGDPEKSGRKHTKAILDALVNMGVERLPRGKLERYAGPLEGAMHFKE